MSIPESASATWSYCLMISAATLVSIHGLTELISRRSPSATSATSLKTARSLTGSPQPPTASGTSTACRTSSTVLAASFGGVSFILGSTLVSCSVIISAPNLSTQRLAQAAGSSITSLTCVFMAFGRGIFISKTSHATTGGCVNGL